MTSPIYQNMISLAVSLPIKRGPSIYTNISAREIWVLKSHTFLCCEIYYFNTITITVLM